MYIHLDWSRKYQIETGLFAPQCLCEINWWQNADWGTQIIYELENKQTVTFNVGNGYKITSTPFPFAFYLQLDASEQVAELIKDKCFVLIICIEKQQELSSIMKGDTSCLLINPFIYEGPIDPLLNDEVKVFDLHDENGNDITHVYWQEKVKPLLIKNGINIFAF